MALSGVYFNVVMNLDEGLFAEDWPNLCWGQFNNVVIDSINTLQITVLKHVCSVFFMGVPAPMKRTLN